MKTLALLTAAAVTLFSVAEGPAIVPVPFFLEAEDVRYWR